MRETRDWGNLAVDISVLTKEYSGRNVIDCLDLQVHRGELFGFLGPNGAGKSTTIRILTTLTKPTSGAVRINGFDVEMEASRVKSEFGIVQQHLSLNRDLTVRENMELHARLHHLSRTERKGRIDELLDYVGLMGQADSLIDSLSGGLKRRTMIARALIHRPKLLFMDEPTVGLDAQSRRKIWGLIRKMNLEGTTVFLTTHYIEEAEALCDRVGIIHQGRLISLGTPLKLRQDLGTVAVEITRSSSDGKDNGSGTVYRYFSDRQSAAAYVKGRSSLDRVTMRESSLEDVFVELTGRKVKED